LVERNNLEGFPLDRLTEIEGDYCGYIEWLKNALSTTTFCERGNIIERMGFFGATLYEYDLDNKLTKQILPHGSSILYEYDTCGNKIKESFANGKSDMFVYDDCDRLTKTINSFGYETVYEYDTRGNMFKQFNSITNNTLTREFKNYNDGQLRRLDNMYIPFFHKNKFKHVWDYMIWVIASRGIHSFEFPDREGASNGEVKRWIEQGAVLINGKRCKPFDAISLPIESLILFPKGKNRNTLI